MEITTVKNKSSGKIISYDCEIADGFFSRLKGLMFSSQKKDLLLISPKEGISESSIHTLFMNYSLDIIWINSEMKIVDIKRKVPQFNFLNPKTWKIYKPKERAKYTLELGKGKIEDSESKIGNEVEFLTPHTHSLH